MTVSSAAFFKAFEKHKVFKDKAFHNNFARTQKVADELGITRVELLDRLERRKWKVGEFRFIPTAGRFDAWRYLTAQKV